MNGAADPIPPPLLKLELNLDAIIAPGQSAVVLCSEIVDFLYNAMSGADLSQKPSNKANRYKFNSPEISADDRRAAFETWTISKAFHELMRGLRASIEQAHLILQVIGKVHKVGSASTLDDFLAPFKREAEKMNFVDLLDRVETHLGGPLHFSDAYLSMQRLRNCLEHRNGIVGDVDAPAGGVLILKFLTSKCSICEEPRK